MNVIKKNVSNTFEVSPHFRSSINNQDFILFDIETTGLSHSKSKVILIGFIIYQGGTLTFQQYFAETLSEEEEILRATLPYFRNNELYISFNGNSFDIPYLNARYKAYNIDYQISKYYSFDLLRFTRKHLKSLELENSKLKTIEQYLGIHRDDTISGKESITLYFEYLKTNSQDILHKILLHNEEDILHMVPLLQITESVGKQFLINYLPNYVRLSKELSYGIADVKIRGEYIYVMLEGINLTPKSFYDYFGVTTLNYNLESLSMNSSGNQMKIVLPIFQTLSNSNDAIGIIDIDLISLFQESFNTLDDQNKHALIISMGKNILYNNLSLFLLRIFNTL